MITCTESYYEVRKMPNFKKGPCSANKRVKSTKKTP